MAGGTTTSEQGMLDDRGIKRPTTSEEDMLQMKLRRVENFLEAQRKREADEAANAKKQLRSRKREVIPGEVAKPTGPVSKFAPKTQAESFLDKMRGDVKNFKDVYCNTKWK